MTHLYVETKSAYNFTVEQEPLDADGAPNTTASIIFLHQFVRDCEDEGGYYHAEYKTFFPWHSILRVTIRKSK